MAWRDEWHARYFAWALRPQIVLAAEIASWSASGGEINSITVTNITIGSVAAVKRGMTIVIGATLGGGGFQRDYRGRARVRKDGSGSTIYVHTPTNYHDGELNPIGGTLIEVWDDYRVWLKPPVSTGGGYYYDGGYGPSLEYGSSGTTIDQWPIANAGPAYAQFVDSGTGLITVSFDGADSFAVADDAVLGAYMSSLFGGSEVVTSTSGTAANAVDNNSATYCEFSTTAVSEYLQVDWGAGNAQPIREMGLKCHSANSPAERILLSWSDDGVYFVTALVVEGITGWGTPTIQWYDNHHVGAHRYWRLYPYNSSSGCRVYDWYMKSEDRTAGTSPYSWDVDDGTITVGSSTSEGITATFPAGFRYVHLTVTDTNGNSHITHVPVLAAEVAEDAISVAGATYDENDGTADYAFDSNVLTSWQPSAIPTLAKWAEITLARNELVTSYNIYVREAEYAPKSWTVHCDGVLVDTQTAVDAFTLNSYRNFELQAPCTGLVWKITVTETFHTSSPYYAKIAEWELMTTAIQSPMDCILRSHTMEPSGQSIDIDPAQILPEAIYPDGTLILIWQDEYYSLVQGSLSDAGPTGREHMVFQGWIDTEPTEIDAEDTGLNKQTTLRCIDTGGRLKQLADFSLMAQRDAAPGAALGYEMAHANGDTFAYLMVEWLSTAASVSDFFWSRTADHFNFGVLASQGANLFDMIEQLAQSFYHHLVCNKHNQLKIIHDPLAAHDEIKTEFAGSVWDTLTAGDYIRIRYTRQRPSRYHWIQHSAVAFNSYDVDSGSYNADPYVGIAPGTIPGQGVGSMDLPDGIYTSWDRIIAPAPTGFAQRIGTEYARAQAPNSIFEIQLGHNGDNGFDPAEMPRKLLVELDADTAAQRGLTVGASASYYWRYGYIVGKRINYDHAAMTRDVILLWEQAPQIINAMIVIEPE